MVDHYKYPQNSINLLGMPEHFTTNLQLLSLWDDELTCCQANISWLF